MNLFNYIPEYFNIEKVDIDSEYNYIQNLLGGISNSDYLFPVYPV